jgi:hypothetical protein
MEVRKGNALMKTVAVLTVMLTLATPLSASAGWLERLGEDAGRTTRRGAEWGSRKGLPAAREVGRRARDAGRRAAGWGIPRTQKYAREAARGAGDFIRGWRRGWDR